MQEWYLISNSNMNNDSREYDDGYALDTFIDLLDAKGIEVNIYDYALLSSTPTKCIVQNRTSNTKQGSVQREFLFPIGSIVTGMYVEYNDRFWIVNSLVDDNGVYEKAICDVCQYKLKWINEYGFTVERWCNVSYSSSNGDIKENNIITQFDNRLSLIVPNDSETNALEGKRVFIDSRTVKQKVFKILRDEDVVYDYGTCGVVTLFATRDEFNPETDDSELGICDCK